MPFYTDWEDYGNIFIATPLPLWYILVFERSISPTCSVSRIVIPAFEFGLPLKMIRPIYWCPCIQTFYQTSIWVSLIFALLFKIAMLRVVNNLRTFRCGPIMAQHISSDWCSLSTLNSLLSTLNSLLSTLNSLSNKQ